MATPPKHAPLGIRRAHTNPTHRSLALALGALDEALDPATAAALAAATFKVSIALTALARAGGEQLSPACQLLSQLHDVIEGQTPA